MKSLASKFAIAALSAALMVTQAGCSKSGDEPTSAANAPAGTAVPAGMVRGTVLETMNAGGYTYVLVDIGAEQRWIATRETSVAVGDVVQASEGMSMSDFTSPSLDRSFEVIYFSEVLQNLSTGSEQAALPHPLPPPGHPPAGMPADEPAAAVETAPADVAVTELAPGESIANVYANKDALAGQEIRLRGKVVKYNSGIMGRNWIHIQDGSGEAPAGNNDLVVTTQDTTAVGETVVVTGTLVLDSDFGSGYTFPVLVENAKVATE